MYYYSFGKPLIAIIGDVRKSRKMENRNELQEQLRNVLSWINKRYEEDIASKFLITLGDEFQGLLHTGKNAVNIVEKIKMELYPIELRIGIGVGNITTAIDSEMALGADGPGYHKARNALDALKIKEMKNKSVISDIRIESEKESETMLVNTIFELLNVIERRWTEKQRNIIMEMIKNQDTQKNIAQKMNITQAAVNKLLNNGNYYAYIKALKDIGKVMECIGNV